MAQLFHGPINFSPDLFEAKVQLIELEKVKEEKRQMFFQQEALKQAMIRELRSWMS